MPSEMFIEQNVIIHKPRKEVYGYLKFCRNQDQFSVWNMADPNRDITHSGTDGEEGFVYSWDSKNKNVGAGSQEIKKMIEDSRIEYELRFERPMKNVSVSRFILDDAGDGKTMVTWDFRGPTKFPMSLLKGVFQRMLTKDIRASLDNLKSVVEG
ncbi:MAG: polyketide cyclase [Bacteroidetes bacterium]|nr:polyketide cyclase [Bacteroidota bacterium]